MPTRTIKSPGNGGDYNTVSQWESDTDVDLVAAGAGPEVGEIYDVDPTSALTIAGATTDASNYRQLTVNAAFRHAGVWDTANQNWQVSATNAFVFLQEAFCRVSWIQFKNTHATTGGGIVNVGAADCLVEQCLGWHTQPTSGDSTAGVTTGSSGTNLVVRNCIFWGCRNGVSVLNASVTGVTIENCTLVANTGRGIASSNGTALTVKNTYAGGNAIQDYSERGVATCASWAFTTSMSSDASARTGVTASVAYDTTNFTNVTATTEDLHLVSGSALRGAGTDLSGTFTIDVDGDTRSAWDIGADEFSSGATSYSLTAEPGSVSLTGTAAGLLSARRVSAEAGSFGISGTAATLRPSRRVSAESGAFSISGQLAALLAARRLSAEAGSVAITGAAAALSVGRRVSAESGLFAVSGTAAGLRADRRLDASAGSFAVSGTDATLTHGTGARLTAEAGSVSISGTAAMLLRAARVAAASGVVVITGAAASLVSGRRLSAVSGSVAITGTDASLRVGHVVAAASGSWAISGTAASLLGARRLDAVAGSFTISGATAALRGPNEALTVTIVRGRASYAPVIYGSASYAPTVTGRAGLGEH